MIAGWGLTGAAYADAPASYRQTAVITVPVNGPLFGDIIYADNASGRVYFSDLSNSSLDVIDGRNDRLLGQVPGFTNGPGGVHADNLGQVWAGNGNGAVTVVQATAPFHVLGQVSVGADTDEIGYDPHEHIIAVSSPDAGTAAHPAPFLTLIDARPVHPGHYRILARVRFPGVGQGALEQPQWDPAIDRFVEAIRTTADAPNGALAVIDPDTGTVTRMINLPDNCVPGGLAVGRGDEVLAGCNVAGPELVDVRSGTEITRYPARGYCCADEVWYDAAAGRYFVAEAGAEGPPPDPQLQPPTVLVIDGSTHRVVTALPLGSTGLGFHQVTALGRRGTIFVPESDGIHVYARRGADQTSGS